LRFELSGITYIKTKFNQLEQKFKQLDHVYI